MKSARRPYVDENNRQKWEYLCEACKHWFKGDEVQADHITPCGSLKSLDDLPGWLERLTPEGTDAFQVLCRDCHKAKTKGERDER